MQKFVTRNNLCKIIVCTHKISNKRLLGNLFSILETHENVIHHLQIYVSIEGLEFLTI